MRLGILTDIHEHVEHLRTALDRLDRLGVDELLVLGDVHEDGLRLAETVDLLIDVGSPRGVYGNHDLGFCIDSPEDLREKYGETAVDYLSGLRASLVVEDCLFTHGLPHWDSTDPIVYYISPDPEEKIAQRDMLRATSEQYLFFGHFHRWVLATERGLEPWCGDRPVTLRESDRYQIGIHAVYDGWCALFDTERRELHPISLTEGTGLT